MSTDSKQAPTAAEVKEATRSLQKAGESLSWTAGFIALPWLKVKPQAEVSDKIETYSIGADGKYTVNPKWYASQRPDERVFELAGGMMKFLMRHFDRSVALGLTDPTTGAALPGQEHNKSVWDRASAMVINAPLQADAIGRAPADAIFPPGDYKGPLDAESLYYHLLKQTPPPPPGQPPPPQGGQGAGQPPPPHAGGGTQPPQQPQGGGDKKDQGDGDGGDGNAPQTGQPGQGAGGLSPDDIDQMRRECEALARQAGRGSHCVEALKPKTVRTNYRSVIPAGLDMANTEASERTQTTYSRAARREALDPGVILSGRIGTDPTIVVVIDFSGSTMAYAQKFVDHAQKLATDFPQTKILLIAHTDRVTYKAWLKPGGEPAKLSEASKVSGGTDFAPAYDAAREEARKLPGARFDSLVHFTDGFNYREWPMPPAKRLVVGLCGADSAGHTPLPCPAKIIPVSMGQ